MTETLKQWRDRISVLSCPCNCRWLAGNKYGNWCCLIGVKMNATILEDNETL